MPPEILQLDVDGEKVTCHQLDGNRLWHCRCTYFQRMLTKNGNGFCPHVAVAIETAIRDGLIDSYQHHSDRL